MRFSIVIPVKNEEKELPKCLKALSDQIFKDYEIIIVDNDSNDNSIKMAEKFNVKILKIKKNSPIGAVRQLGCENARGEIICNIDADCEPKSDWLLILDNDFKNNYVGVAGPLKAKDGGITGSFFIFHYNFILFISHFFNIQGAYGANFAIKKSILEKIGGFNKNTCHSEDFEVSLKAGKIGKIYLNKKLHMPTSSRSIKKGFFKTIYGGLLYDLKLFFNCKDNYKE